jgi:DNA-binding NarL/FixJ family response regulator
VGSVIHSRNDKALRRDEHESDATLTVGTPLTQGIGNRMTVRILLVDDHPIVRQGLRTLLQGREDWEVVGEASDGVEALEKVSDLQPDVVVLDVTMPRMNGLEACRMIQRKQKNGGPEVLFVTQHDSPQMMREALDAGARGYVVKSNAARDLLEAVESVSQHRVFTALARNSQVTSQ